MAESNTGWLDSVAKIVSVVISPRIAVTVFLSSCVLLAASHWVAGRADLLPAQYRPFLVITVVFSGVLSVSYGFTAGWSALSTRRSAKRAATERASLEEQRLARLHARLAALTLPEKHILQEYIEGDSRIAQFNATRGRCDALCNAGILRITQMYGIQGTYEITDDAWNYLLMHRDLIGTPDNPRPPRSFFSEY